MVCLSLLAVLATVGVQYPEAEQGSGAPSARLIAARTLRLPGEADSNSPAVWQLVDGVRRLFLLTSISGSPTRHSGTDLQRMTRLGPVAFTNHPGHGVWMESVVADVDGSWYGYYHNEVPATVCNETERTIPRIGAARSRDLGATWEDLGILLEAPARSYQCDSQNDYFVGGVGDFSAILDADEQYLYFFFSQYVRFEPSQGVSVARLAWADRDAPAGKITVWWRDEAWLPIRSVVMGDRVRQAYPVGKPIYAAQEGWHGADDAVDAFWGPAVHWNTHLEQYVMLLNRAKDATWSQEGIYVAYAPRLDNPSIWTAPERLLSGGRWYPQVMGLEPGGSDKHAGEFARFFMSGRSEHVIQFTR